MTRAASSQTSMKKQSISVSSLNGMYRNDANAFALCNAQKPLVESWYSSITNTCGMPQGMSAIVAIACYGGFNQEDSVLLKRSAVDRGLGLVCNSRVLKVVPTGDTAETFEIPGPRVRHRIYAADYTMLDADGLISVGSAVGENTVVVGRTVTRKGTKFDRSVLARTSGLITSVAVSENDQGKRVIRIHLTQIRRLELGDKLSSRHGQKGTVGCIVPDEDMPFDEATGITPGA